MFEVVVTLDQMFLLLQHGHPYISAMVSNGSFHYDHDRDGTHTALDGCEAQFRQAKHETFIAIRYERNRLMVSEQMVLDVDATCGHIVVIRLHCSNNYRRSTMVCLSIMIVSPAKAAESMVMLFWMLTRMGTRNHLLDEDPDPPMRRGNFVGMTFGFFHMLLWTVFSGSDVRISLLAVHQHSAWLAAEAVKCHMKFSQ